MSAISINSSPMVPKSLGAAVWHAFWRWHHDAMELHNWRYEFRIYSVLVVSSSLIYILLSIMSESRHLNPIPCCPSDASPRSCRPPRNFRGPSSAPLSFSHLLLLLHCPWAGPVALGPGPSIWGFGPALTGSRAKVSDPTRPDLTRGRPGPTMSER